MTLKSGITRIVPVNTAPLTLNYIFTDDFSENKLISWTRVGTAWDVISGELSGSSINDSTTGLAADNFQASDFSGSILFRLISGVTGSGGLGIQLRLLQSSADSVSNCLFITFRHSGSVVLNSGSYNDNPNTTMASASMGINPTGSAHTGSFLVSGSTVQVWIDDSLKITYTGSFNGINAGNSIRLVVLSGSDGRFDNVLISPYNAFLTTVASVLSTAITPSGITGSLQAMEIYMKNVTPALIKCRGGFLTLDLFINGIQIDTQNIHNTLEHSTDAYFTIPLSAFKLDQSNTIVVRNSISSPIIIQASYLELKYQGS